MITSPTPTQQPPDQPGSEPEQRDYAPRKRTGQKPAALFFKAILRPIFKGIYYLLSGIRNHKLIALLIVVLLIASATTVDFVETGQWPFGIANDQFNFHIHGTNGGGDQVKDWLYSLRDGDVVALGTLDRFMSQQPDAQGLVNQYSQAKTNLTWKNISVVGVQQESDGTVDSFVEVDLSATGPGGPVSAYLIFHFVSETGQTGGSLLLNVEVSPSRGSATP
jgi:hypothetical protein